MAAVLYIDDVDAVTTTTKTIPFVEHALNSKWKKGANSNYLNVLCGFLWCVSVRACKDRVFAWKSQKLHPAQPVHSTLFNVKLFTPVNHLCFKYICKQLFKILCLPYFIVYAIKWHGFGRSSSCAELLFIAWEWSIANYHLNVLVFISEATSTGKRANITFKLKLKLKLSIFYT